MIEVYLDDGDGVNFSEADAWANNNCQTYKGVEVTDVSDFSYFADEIAIYKFDCSSDAAWFTMQWKGRNYGS